MPISHGLAPFQCRRPACCSTLSHLLRGYNMYDASSKPSKTTMNNIAHGHSPKSKQNKQNIVLQISGYGMFHIMHAHVSSPPHHHHHDVGVSENGLYMGYTIPSIDSNFHGDTTNVFTITFGQSSEVFPNIFRYRS